MIDKIIEIKDGSKLVVLDELIINREIYFFCCDVDEAEENIKNNFNFLKVEFIGSKVNVCEIKNNEERQMVMREFFKRMNKEFNE